MILELRIIYQSFDKTQNHFSKKEDTRPIYDMGKNKSNQTLVTLLWFIKRVCLLVTLFMAENLLLQSLYLESFKPQGEGFTKLCKQISCNIKFYT